MYKAFCSLAQMSTFETFPFVHMLIKN